MRTWTPRSIQPDEKGDCQIPHTHILQLKKRNCTINRCKFQATWHMLVVRTIPVYFVSKALTVAQQGYVAIEIESLAVAWAMEKFHHFLYASHFILETDQKPLEAILSKNLNQATPRLQRILIRTFPYNFTVHYIPAVTNQLADYLSRLEDQKDTMKLLKLYVYQITQQLSARSDSLHQLRLSMQADDELTLLKHTIMQMWLKSFKQVSLVLQPFWTFREELTVEDGLILKGTRIVIPTK